MFVYGGQNDNNLNYTIRRQILQVKECSFAKIGTLSFDND